MSNYQLAWVKLILAIITIVGLFYTSFLLVGSVKLIKDENVKISFSYLVIVVMFYNQLYRVGRD